MVTGAQFTPATPPEDRWAPNPNEDRVTRILARAKKMETEKQPWLNTFQTIGEYVYMRRQNFTTNTQPGQFLTTKVFDSTAPKSLHQMASSLIGALYPGSNRVFRILPPENMSKEDATSRDVIDFYSRCTSVMASKMNHPKAGLMTSLEEYMMDEGAFGIAGIAIWEMPPGHSHPISYNAIDAKRLTVDEGPDGFIDTEYITTEVSVKALIQEFKVEGVSKSTREAYYQNRLSDMVKVMHCIEPRLDLEPGKIGADNMPYMSLKFEIESKHILAESGYEENPVKVCRFWKCMNEKYGRSPAMETMPDIIEANLMREALIIATEKILDPPTAATDDGSLAGPIDTSAGAINVRHVSGRISEQSHRWIEPVFTVGDIKPAKERILELQESIANSFFIDRLIDLNNESRMTAYETNVRNTLRGQSLGTVYARQVMELFTPLIERSFNILLRNGYFGVDSESIDVFEAEANGEEPPPIIPEAVLKLIHNGQDAYRIEYITPADRVMKQEELTGIQQTTAIITELGGINPDVFDSIDIDIMMKHVVEYTGAPEDIIRDSETIRTIRAARQEAQMNAQAEQSRHTQSATAKNIGAAAQSAANAGIDPNALLGGGGG